MEQNCKECNILKDINDFYKHPQWKNGVLWRCKECIKRWRKSKREKIMSRKRDTNRYHNNIKRNIFCRVQSKNWKIINPEKTKAQQSVNNYYRWIRKNEKPTSCCVCGESWRIHMHHKDYNFSNKVYPLCPICHSNFHIWNIELNIKNEITLDFSDKRRKN